MAKGKSKPFFFYVSLIRKHEAKHTHTDKRLYQLSFNQKIKISTKDSGFARVLYVGKTFLLLFFKFT